MQGFFLKMKMPLESIVGQVRKLALRSDEVGRILVCAVVGGITGAIVSALRALVEALQRFNFALPGGTPLSLGGGADAGHDLLVPILGGLVVGVVTLWFSSRGMREVVDPVEANALYGGRMSLIDSGRLAFTNVLSNIAGASIGMEAGYSQLGAGLFSRIGQLLNLRRGDQRIFVTAGAAAAIAAAFNAPLAGAFYGFELILGNYTIAALAPVTIAALSATLVDRAISAPDPWFALSGTIPLDMHSYFLFGSLGVLAAGLGILTMLAVTRAERLVRALKVPSWLHPAVGGLALGLIALYFPQVLGSGHGALQYYLAAQWALLPLALLLLAKFIASAISVGSGFRGGLFSASLFLGSLFGAVCADALLWFDPLLKAQYGAFALVGMGSTAAAIVGAPLTMVFLVLETTGNFGIAAGVLVGVLIATTIVRLGFGYSFSTWRFHQRGIGIRGAHDIGWVAELSVGRLMRSDARTVTYDTPLSTLREQYPAGSARWVFVTGAEGRYRGAIDLSAVHDAEGVHTAEDLAESPDDFLLPGEDVRMALARFEETGRESLPVLSSDNQGRVLGVLSEQYALRRYTQELEHRRNVELGQRDLFPIGPVPEQ